MSPLVTFLKNVESSLNPSACRDLHDKQHGGYVAEHSRANIMVVEDEEQYAKVLFNNFYSALE